MNVLVAEDSPDQQVVVANILEHSGHSVEIAGDGRKAVEMLIAGDFDVVLMDVRMPTMDGIEAVRFIRSMEDSRRATVPIIAVTASEGFEREQDWMKVGLSGFLPKPVNSENLLQLMNALARGEAANATILSELDDDMGTPTDSQSENRPGESLNIDAALRRLGGDAALLRDLVRFFLEDSPGLLETLDSALQAGNADEVTRAAHTLKGSASTFDAEACIKTAAQLERLGRAGDLANAAPVSAELRLQVESLNQQLQSLKF